MQAKMRQNAALVLASGSPRRKDFLDQLGLAFKVITSDVDETSDANESEAVPKQIAMRKVSAVKRGLESTFDGWILGADTVVVLEGEIFGKPVDDAHAASMLQRLSGRDHRVLTAVYFENMRGEVHETLVSTTVRMASLTTKEISDYVATGEPRDKAGAYAIQGKASYMIQRIDGSYTNVVGLPLHETVLAMAELGIVSLG